MDAFQKHELSVEKRDDQYNWTPDTLNLLIYVVISLLYWIRFVASVGRSVSNSCPLYNSFTNGRISFKLE